MKAAPITLIALASLGCSVVVGDLTPGACMRFEDCEELNGRDDLDEASCELWTCRFDRGQLAGICERGPRDVDGDGVPGPHPSAAACVYEPSDCDDLDRLRDGSDETCDGADNDCDLAIDEALEPGTFAGASIPLGTIGTQGELRFAPSPELLFATLSTSTATGVSGAIVPLGAESASRPLSYETYCGEATPRAGCGLDDCATVSAGCSAGQAALDRAADGAWIAAVNLTGCATGELRVGRYDGAGHVEIDSAGDAAFGAPPCTGEGVRAPSLASLDPSTASGPALVAHYVEPWNAPRACGAEASVRAVRLQGAASASGRSGRFELEGTIDLGSAASTTPPAIAALADRSGWIVAFGRGAGGVSVERVSASGEHTAVGVIEGAAPASQVVMRSGESGVGLAWIEGCSGGAARFAIVRPSGAIEGPTTIDAMASEVAIVALSTGLVEPGFTRGERTAQEADQGGWLLVTRDESAVRAHRVLALDAAVLGAPQSVALAIRALGLVTSAGALPADLHAWQSDGELVRVPLGCGR